MPSEPFTSIDRDTARSRDPDPSPSVDDYVKDVVAAAPPFTAGQYDRLRALLRAAPSRAA
jgi:hypothetical protein